MEPAFNRVGFFKAFFYGVFMNDFKAAMADAAGDLLASYVDDVTYTKHDGHRIEKIAAALNEEREIIGGDYQSSYLATTFIFETGLVESINRGDQILHKGKSWIVEAPLSEDQYFVEVIVK